MSPEVAENGRAIDKIINKPWTLFRCHDYWKFHRLQSMSD